MTRPTITTPPGLPARFLRGAFLTSAFAFALSSASILAVGCLDRPVAPATPNVSARIVEKAKQNKVSKIDLLFMIDNSSSMADKQEILKVAVPDLVGRLVNPICIDPMKGNAPAGPANAQGICAPGLERDFEPIKDIHIGVISSSLGGHGSPSACAEGEQRQDNPMLVRDNNDRARLLTRGAPAVGARGFLNFHPGQQGALATEAEVTTPFTSMVTGVAQYGCGYEAQLESIYRFLNDPEPYDKIEATGDPRSPRAMISGIDNTLLQQRADFLRPDSLVAAIMVTDENDCSIADVQGGQNFYPLLATPKPSTATTGTYLKHGTTACLTNPNDRCCVNCGQAAPEGCTPTGEDAECGKGALTRGEDPENLRCWNQKKRYGIDFLYPPQRYVEALTQPTLSVYRTTQVPNPLFSDLQCKNNENCAAQRDPSLVFLAGIVGVPWQDIAKDPASLKSGFKVAADIDWSKILGDPRNPAGPIPPSDPHMIESVEPRTRQGLADVNAAANADPIHGHEWSTDKISPLPNSDLQFACIFPLPAPKACGSAVSDCDCRPDQGSMAAPPTTSPLCQVGNAYSTNQVKAKAYPGTRELEVLKGIGDQAIVASICPANVADPNASDYGYRPAIEALINRLRNALRGRCLPRQLEVDEATKQVPCVIVEAFNPAPGSDCNCEDPMYAGRSVAAGDVITPEIKAAGTCRCVINQLEGGPQDTCRRTTIAPADIGGGWCYVDPAQNVGSCDVVSACSPTDRRLIKFVNTQSEPRPGATAYIMCQEKSFPSTGGAAPVDPCAAK